MNPQVQQWYSESNTGLHNTAFRFYQTAVNRVRPHWAIKMEEERQQRQQQQAAQQPSAKTVTLLEDAYDQQAAKNREAHNARFNTNQDDHTSEAPPGSPGQSQEERRKHQPKRAAQPS